MTDINTLVDELKRTETPLIEAIPSGKIIIYGGFGVGKTVAAFKIAHAILPPDKWIYYLDTSDGWLSLLNHPELRERTTKNRFKGFSQIDTLTTAITEDIQGFGKYGVLILDEYSTMSDIVLDRVVMHRDELGKQGKLNQKGQREGDVADWPDRNVHTRLVRRNIDALYSVPNLTIIILAHERTTDDDGTTMDFPLACRVTIGKRAHTISRMHTSEDGKRIFTSHPVRRVEAKTRIAGLGRSDSDSKFVDVVSNWLLAGGPLENENNNSSTFEGILVE